MAKNSLQDAQKQTELVTGFLGGGNSFQDETLIKDSELTEYKNILLSVDGIEPRPGTTAYGGSQDSRVMGLFPYYKSDNTRKFLRVSNGKLYYKNGDSWTQIGSTTWTTTAFVNMLQVSDNVYIFNGVESLRYTDGSTITSFTTLSTPTGLTVTPTGGTGSTAYSYRVSAFNNVGETLACASVAISNGVATLSTTTYNALAWTTVASAVGYNIFGRKATGIGETYLATAYTNSYNDTATTAAGDYLEPSLVILPPEANTTVGIICKKGVFSQSRIFAAGDPSQPSRLYYGGVGSNINNFSFSDTGGGATDIFKNDGAIIRDILPFQGGVIVWKDNAIYKFYFNTSGQPVLEEITRSFGGISFRGSKHVENDVIFPAKKDGRLAFYSLGNQENYSASVLRTNELSIKIAEDLEDVSLSQLPNCAAFYFNNIYACAIGRSGQTVNNRIWCLDTRFGAWVYWDGLYPNSFTEYTDTDGTQKMYYGGDNDGYVYEMFTEDRNDNGSAISVAWSLKAFNQKRFDKYKKYYNPVFQFKDVTISGAIEGDIIVDGAIVSSNFTVSQQNTGGGGFGAFLFGFDLFGDAPGVFTSTGLSADTIVEVNFIKNARSIKYAFRSDTLNARYKFLSVANTYKILEGKRLPSSSRVYGS